MSDSEATKASSALTDALERALRAGEVGIQVAAYLHGELIVDAWAGQDGRGRAVGPDTLFPVFSVTKAVLATAVHRFAQRELIDLDRPIAEVWPQYARYRKGAVTFDHVLSHRSGAPTIGRDTTIEELCDWQAMAKRVADQIPVSSPGTQNAYSPFAFGWVLGEALRRADPERRDFRQIIQDEVLEPLKMTDFHLGLAEEHSDRVALLLGASAPTADRDSVLEQAAPAHLPFGPTMFNDPGVQRAGLPSAGGIATARATARLFIPYADGGNKPLSGYLSEHTLQRCSTPRPTGIDLTYGVEMPVGCGGLWLFAPGVSEEGPGGTITNVMSHTGAGGTVAWADPSTGLAVAVLHNRMFFGPQQPQPFSAIGGAIHDIATEHMQPR